MKRLRVYLNILLFAIRNPTKLYELKERDVWLKFDPNLRYGLSFKRYEDCKERDFRDLILSAVDSFPPYTPLVIFEAAHDSDKIVGAYWPELAGWGPWNIKYFHEICSGPVPFTDKIPFEARTKHSHIKWVGHVEPGMPIPEVAI
ncbi:hypothetical protein LCGC14_1233010 [marine sediment metagenome]|uniref:Uncharacterized protein n=1 Tax=marine sediment metagenome TaxID=412755 RepID=A0A0F9LC31_9ZZZZ